MAQNIRIPTESSKATTRVTLGGNVFKMFSIWMERVGGWTISFKDANDNEIFSGITLRENQEVTGRYPEFVTKMAGQLWLIRDPESSETAITRTNVNSDFKLVYISTRELESQG